MIFCDDRGQKLFYHSITNFAFLQNAFESPSNSSGKQSAVFHTEQNILCSKTHLDVIVHEKTIFCNHLFVVHLQCRGDDKENKNA